MLCEMCVSGSCVSAAPSTGSNTIEGGRLGAVGLGGGLFFAATSVTGAGGGGGFVLVAGGTELGSFGVGGCGTDGGLAYGVLGADAALHVV